jgi:hypothetical protein
MVESKIAVDFGGYFAAILQTIPAAIDSMNVFGS